MSTSMLNSDLYTYEYFQQGDVCRLCWNRNAEKDIYSKTITDNMRVYSTLEHIHYCLNIDMEGENFPKKTCNSCCTKLVNFYDFKSLCVDNDRKLREILKRSISVTPNDVKLEHFDDFPDMELSKTDTLDSFLDALNNSGSNNSFDSPEKKKSKVKKLYRPKKTPTYCNICRIDFGSIEKFTSHNSGSHGVEDTGQFKCFGCEKRFKSRKTRLGHEIKFCKGLKDGYKCSKCDRYLPKRRMYESHMRDHRDKTTVELPEELFKCTKCCKLFKTKDGLKKHMVSHEPEKKNFVCETCGRVFTRQDYLHKHKLTHTGIKQHVCPHCGFRATQRSSLTVHIRKHTGERPYSCDVCPQRCISSSNLRAHRRRHLGVKKYQCTICPKKFGYKISLEEHVASTHEREQSHPCQLCGAVYTRVRGLRRHLLAKHGINAKQKEPQVNSDEKGDQQTDELYIKISNEVPSFEIKVQD